MLRLGPPLAYRQQTADARLRATYVDRFSRDLPRALAGLPNTAAVACRSRSESQGYLPIEGAPWARHVRRPVVCGRRSCAYFSGEVEQCEVAACRSEQADADRQAGRHRDRDAHRRQPSDSRDDRQGHGPHP